MTESESALRRAVIDEAMTWLKTPFHHRQCVKGAGTDCANFPKAVYAAIGLIPAIEIEEYPHDWHMHKDKERYLGWVLKFAKILRSGPYLPADFVVWRFGRVFSHGAIVVRWPQIIHAWRHAGMVMLDDAETNTDLPKRPHIFFRYKDWA
jgi:cell wall-associated NlpC family hydrolase